MSARQRALYCNVRGSFKSQSYVVVDVGGGTVDIVAYQIRKLPEPHMEVLHEPTGGAWGGRNVNLKFKTFLETLTGDKGFLKYIEMGTEEKRAKHRAELDEIVEECFESQKTIFGDDDLDESARITVHLNFSFLKEYRSEIEQSIHSRNIHQASVDDSDLCITYEKVKDFFNPVVDGIIECAASVVTDVPDARTVYLVGGFGGCQYIYNRLCARFGENYKFVTPEGRNYAVVQGAAMMRQKPLFLNARRVDATYGIETSIPFEEGKHDPQYRIRSTVPGEPDMCSNIFTTFVEKGDVVTSQDVYMMTFTPERNDQRYMKVLIYSSSEKDVWYTTGKRPAGESNSETWADVQHIGELIIPFRTTDGDETVEDGYETVEDGYETVEDGDETAEDGDETVEDQAVDVMFDFSGAEIKVTGFHRSSETEVRVVLNFLEA